MAIDKPLGVPALLSRNNALCLQIKDFVKQMLVDFSRGELPSVSISKYQICRCFSEESRSTVYEKSGFQEKLGLHQNGSARRLVIMLRVLGIVQQLLEEGKHASKRDIYYTDPAIFQDVKTIDQAINDICIRFHCSRSSLHVVSVSKGVKAIRMLPLEGLKKRIEYFAGLSCLLLMLNIQWSSFLRLLKDKLGLPIFALVDGDPHGLDILLTYTFGSLNMAYDAEALVTPHIYWLGIFLSDCKAFGIPTHCLLPLSPRDKQKASAILKRGYLTHYVPSWSGQVELMLQQGVKLEIEAIASVSFSFLADVYLPSKIKNGAYL